MTRQYTRVVASGGDLRLHLNENTAGCSPAVAEAIAGLTTRELAVYPDYDDVTAACAGHLGSSAERLLLTNGLDDGILAVAVAASRHSPEAAPFEALIVVPAFDMYGTCAEAAGSAIVEVPLGPDFAFPLAQVLAAVTDRTRSIFLTNPNNPTGTSIPRPAILEIARRAPQALVLLDEAYADFSGETLIGDADAAALPNLLVGRTFAKAYGLAGLRAGALVGDPRTLAPLRRTVPPYTLNVCAAVALPAALADRRYYDWYRSQVEESKALLYAALDRLGVAYWRSGGNFVLARFGDGVADVVRQLGDRHIAIRDRSQDPGCAGCARITTGVVEHTRACIAALEEVLCERAS